MKLGSDPLAWFEKPLFFSCSNNISFVSFTGFPNGIGYASDQIPVQAWQNASHLDEGCSDSFHPRYRHIHVTSQALRESDAFDCTTGSSWTST